MAYGLLKRILAHAKIQGWLKEGDVILDPFGGIGSTGILGAYEGYQVVCCELEVKFCKLAELNFRLHDNIWSKLGCPRPVIIQGDSRQLCEIVEKADCIVSSPPFLQSVGAEGGAVKRPNDYGHNGQFGKTYGKSNGQLGAMKPGKVDAIISSPPYAESLEHSGGIDPSKSKYTGGPNSQMNRSDTRYGQAPGNLGNLKSGDVDAIISSPPYEGIRQDGGRIAKEGVGGFKPYTDEPVYYGKNKRDPKNLGNQEGDTFWQAAKSIVQQCHQILKPGGHAIWVVKSFVRKGKIVDFPGDWQRLCEAVGFKTVCVHHAMLYKEPATLLMDWAKKKRTERVSFFRRNANNKAAWRNYWKTLTEEVQSKWLAKANQKLPKGKQSRILQKAQEFAFVDTGEVHWDWNDNVRIDFEVVLCMQKD